MADPTRPDPLGPRPRLAAYDRNTPRSRGLGGSATGRIDASDPKAVASQFEALVIQTMLRSMRETVGDSGLWGGSGTDLARSMLEQTLAEQVAQAGGMGLADVLAKEMGVEEQSLTSEIGRQRGAQVSVGPADTRSEEGETPRAERAEGPRDGPKDGAER